MIRILIDLGARVLTAAAVALLILFGRRGVRPPPFSSELGSRPGRDTGTLALTKRWGYRAIVVLGALAVGSVLVAVSGIVPIAASGGHWALTERILQFGKRRSVATYSLGIRVPQLDDPVLVLKGAGHFDSACRPCHGSPTFDQPRLAERMTPRPPDLTGSVRRYDDQALFYLVKHGIKFTGMPAWPALQREDEVWAMVAFLRKLPDLTRREYEALARGPVEGAPREPLKDLLPPPEAPEAVTDSCSRCHGDDGLGRGNGAFPVLAGQHVAYLRATLHAYHSGQRHSGIMEPVAAGLGPEDIQQIAEYYAALPWRRVNGRPPAIGDVERGRRIAHEGLPDRLVPACLSCHGQHEIRRNPHYARLAGQYPDYLRLQLRLFRDRQRGGTPYAHIMQRVASQLTDESIADVAAYLATLPPVGQAP